jgi:hypothetical protein
MCDLDAVASNLSLRLSTLIFASSLSPFLLRPGPVALALGPDQVTVVPVTDPVTRTLLLIRPDDCLSDLVVDLDDGPDLDDGLGFGLGIDFEIDFDFAFAIEFRFVSSPD